MKSDRDPFTHANLIKAWRKDPSYSTIIKSYDDEVRKRRRKSRKLSRSGHNTKQAEGVGGCLVMLAFIAVGIWICSVSIYKNLNDIEEFLGNDVKRFVERAVNVVICAGTPSCNLRDLLRRS